MIENNVEVDQIDASRSGVVHVRTKTSVFEDGVFVSQSFHRHIVAPGDDYSGEDARVQAICDATHTQETIDAYKASIAPKEI